MKILEPLVRRSSADTDQRISSLEDWYQMTYDSHQYPLGVMTGSNPEDISSTFLGYVESIHRKNGAVSAAVVARALLVSQLRFVWRRDRTSSKRGELWGNRDLSPLERPGSTSRPNLLFQLEQDASYDGSAYVVKSDNGLRRLSPDRCSFLLGSDSDSGWDADGGVVVPHDAETIALLYHPDKNNQKSDLQAFLPGEFAVWSPEPDPVHFWRGQSWVTSVVREIVTDGQATDHQQKFFKNAATPNLVFLMDPSKTPEQTQEYANVVNAKHSGAANAYRNMFLGGGTDVKVVGSTLESLNLKDLTGGLENRVSMRSRVPAVVLGAREGLSGSSLNAGNYGSARRLFADGWFAPAAASLSAALESVVNRPGGSELWYDASEVLFLQEDQKDAAEIQSTQAAAMRQLIDGGFEPGSVVEAIKTGDMSKLKHTGNVSVQLQPPGTGQKEQPNDDDNA